MEGELTSRDQVYNDEHLLRLWLHGRSPHTQRAYLADALEFLGRVAKPLRWVSLSDVQEYAASIEALAGSSRARKLSSVKSLLAFGHRLGYLAFDVGAPARLPKVRNRLSERILTERQVIVMLELETNPRDRLMLELLYYTGCRLAELCGLRRRDLQANGDSGQVTLFGKGGKTRSVLLPLRLYEALLTFAGWSELDEPLFRSQKGGPVSPVQVERIVKRAAKRAGLPAEVSPHWLRHAHASHALDRGAPPHLVQSTLGHASLATTSQYAHARPTESSGLYLRD